MKSNAGIAFVLLSGGIDSTTCLFEAVKERDLGNFTDVLAVGINYGQRHVKELESAAASCNKLDVAQMIIAPKDIFPTTMLTDSSVELPNASYDDLPEGVSPTYVPFRNGTMLSLITAQAQGYIEATNKIRKSRGGTPLRESAIYYGAHAEDAANWAYPDCTPEFNGAMANAIFIGTYYQIRLHTPLQWMTKDEIIAKGTKLGVEWRNTWSCYDGKDLHCGTCPTCRARKQAFADASVYDPTMYSS